MTMINLPWSLSDGNATLVDSMGNTVAVFSDRLYALHTLNCVVDGGDSQEVESLRSEIEDLKVKVDDLEYSNEKLRDKLYTLESNKASDHEKLIVLIREVIDDNLDGCPLVEEKNCDFCGSRREYLQHDRKCWVIRAQETLIKIR